MKLSPIPQNVADYVNIETSIAFKPKQIVEGVKDMIANYAKHEDVFVDFRNLEYVAGNSGVTNNAYKQNSVSMTVYTKSQAHKSKDDCFVLTRNDVTLAHEDKIDNIRALYNAVQKAVEKVKKIQNDRIKEMEVE